MGHAGSTSGGDSSEMVIYHLNSLAGSRASGQPPAASGSNAESQGVTSSVDLMPCTPAVAFHVPRMVRNKQSVQQLDGEVGFGTAESGHSAKHFGRVLPGCSDHSTVRAAGVDGAFELHHAPGTSERRRLARV